jgi:hypothetical protein
VESRFLCLQPQLDEAAIAAKPFAQREAMAALSDGIDPRYVLYSVRAPSPRLDDAALIALGNDDEFGAALAAWLADRAR